MTTYRVLSDLLYRSVATVTTSNVVTEAYDCDAYGNTLCYSGPGTDGAWFTDDDVRTNSPVNTTIFTGRQYDPESQIYYYRARYYSPQIGRFLSRDPLKNAEWSQGANLYWYISDNAPNGLDPHGLQSYIGPGYGSLPSTYNNSTNDEFVEHYMGGSGAPLHVPFSEFDPQWGDSDFNGFEDLVQNACSSMSNQPVNLSRVYDAGSTGPGRVSVDLKGTISYNKYDCTWNFSGNITIENTYIIFIRIQVDKEAFGRSWRLGLGNYFQESHTL